MKFQRKFARLPDGMLHALVDKQPTPKEAGELYDTLKPAVRADLDRMTPIATHAHERLGSL